jgi:Viral BACON domain
MEIKRCQRCHKLLRADAQTCSRCGGYDFLPVSQTKTRLPGALLPGETASAPSHATYPSSPTGSPLSPLPPTQLSPHRAGHYSGLHPEDEPYQSSFLPVQRAPLSAQPALDVEEVEDLTYSTVPDMPGTSAPVALPKRQVASLTPLPTPRQQRSAQIYREPSLEQNETERDLEAARISASTATIAGPRPLALATRPPRRQQRGMVVRLLLIISCFLFVVATGILSFLLLDSKPTPVLKPQLTAESVGPLRVNGTLLLYGSRFEANATVKITRDTNIAVMDAGGNPLQAHTFSTGNFFVSITIGEDWAVGSHVIYAADEQNHKAPIVITVRATPTTAPLLQLAFNHIDVGEDSASVVSHKSITLTNGGGGKVTWQGSSDSPTWLKLTPTNGSFAGGQQVVITVDRSNLAPQSYTGHISFTQQDSKQPALALTVTMGVNPASANLVISNAAFTFAGDTVNNPVTQAITIQNTGGQGLNWTATVSTANGGNWVALSSNSGYLAAGAVSNMTVSAVSAGLSIGTYQGTITFSYAGASATPVTVTLNVNPPPVAKVAISPGGLSFHAIMGQNPRAQSFTLTNSGNAPLNWGILEDSNGKTYAPVTQSSGTLAPSKSVAITVLPSIAQAGAGTLNALITVIDTDAGTPVKSQQVKVTFTIVNQAVISLNQSQFIFNQTSAIPVSSQLVTLTNTGSAPLNWSLTITNTSPISWLTDDNAGGTVLNPGGADFINVQCDSTNLSPGTFTATLTLRDTATVNPAAPLVVTVTVVVS